MNVADAVRVTVRDYPGGSGPLAERMSMSGAMLRNKTNPGSSRNVLSLDEAQWMMELTGDHRILQAQAAELGYALLRIDTNAVDEPESSLVGMILDVHATSGEFSRVVADAMTDGLITPNEMAAIQKAGHAEQGAMINLIKRLRALSSQRSVQ